MKYIGAEERKALFGTPVRSRQIVKFCRHEGATRDTIYEAFSDQGREKVRRTVNSLLGRGWLAEAGGRLHPTDEGLCAVENDADRVWKAARYMKVFTVADLMKITGLGRDYIYDYCLLWCSLGSIRKISDIPGSWSTFQMCDDRVDRPVAGRKYDRHRYEN